MKKFISVALLTVNIWALPPQVEADKLALGAKASIDANDFIAAFDKLERLKSLNVKLPDAYWYYYGSTLLSLERGEEAIAAFDKYLEQGAKAKYYKEALEKYDKAEAMPKYRVYLDKPVGLMWQDMDANDRPHLTWQKAKDHCDNLNYYGFNDWRLPNINDFDLLFPIADALKWKGGHYWTIEEDDKDNRAFWYEIIKGRASKISKSTVGTVRCVRNSK